MDPKKHIWILLFPALTANSGEFDIRGYGTVGAVYSIDSGAEYIRDLGQPNGVSKNELNAKLDSRFGLQLDYSHNKKLSFTVQALSKYQADATFTPEINWAFMKYKVSPELELRVGRTNLDFLFQGDEVNLGFTSLTVRPPIDFYTLPVSVSDGIDLDYTTPFKDGYFTSSIGIGVATKDESPFGDTLYDVEKSPLIGAALNYETLNWSLKLSYGQMKLNKDPDPLVEFINLVRPHDPEFADSLGMKDKWSSYYSLGGTWSRGNWSSVFAIGSVSTKTKTYPSSDMQLLKVGYRINKLTPYVSASMLKAGGEIVVLNSGTLVDMIAAEGQTYFQADRSTYSIGARYELTSNVAIKAQYDLVETDPKKTFTVLNYERGWDGSFKLFTLALDYYF